MHVENGLKHLASLLPEPLYLVGGCVRDAILGFNPYDYDICSALSPAEVLETLGCVSGIKISTTSPKLGTLKITYEGVSYEYTTFRTDSYACDGSHEPVSVAFTQSIKADSLRRDFTINALYYDISNDKIIDPLGQIKDIENRTLRTTRDAQSVFEEDALRLLRAVRISAETGCTISIETVDAIKNNAFRLQQIAIERITDELSKMLVADTKNNISEAHTTAICKLSEYGLMQYIIPEISHLAVNTKMYMDIIDALQVSQPHIRLATLLYNQDKETNVSAKSILQRLKFSNAIVDTTARIIDNCDFNNDLQKNTIEKRQFVQQNFHLIEQIVALKLATSNGDLSIKKSAEDLLLTKQDMIANNVPITIADLKINGNDLIAHGIAPNKRGAVMKSLLLETAHNSMLQTRQSQLAFIKK